jgi:hypothetical protein
MTEVSISAGQPFVIGQAIRSLDHSWLISVQGGATLRTSRGLKTCSRPRRPE